jgi:hypothetical protein
MRLDPIIGEHPPVVCVQCHKHVIEGVVYEDLDSVTEDYYCRQCADEMASFPPYRRPRNATA